MDYYPAMKRNTFESVLMRNLEPIIQSEVSQEEKEKYCMLMHTHGIRKKVLMILLAGEQRRHRHFGHSRGRRGCDDMRE